MLNSGTPVGTAPICSISSDSNAARQLPINSARSGAGKYLLILAGVKNMTPITTRLSSKALMSSVMSICGTAESIDRVEPSMPATPNRGGSCRIMMIMPMPLMKPDTTGCGTSLM